jgi:hypothetical protein
MWGSPAYWLVPVFGAAGGAIGGILRDDDKGGDDNKVPDAGEGLASDNGEPPADNKRLGLQNKKPRSNSNKLVLCKMDRHRIELGIVGDLCTGLGGACSVVFLLNGLLLRGIPKSDSADSRSDIALLMSVSFLAGVVGKNIIEYASRSLLKQVEQTAKEAGKKAANEQVELQVPNLTSAAKETAAAQVAPTTAIAWALAARGLNEASPTATPKSSS